mmetsp:Transcript_35423/g.75439  ORF Transcript_35423/g.75439 Transcript_35423/m.75439 type:complete len:219 (-) Transcript_35423:51-707(-)
MGASLTGGNGGPQPPAFAQMAVPMPVILNIYDVTTRGGIRALNRFLKVFGTGAFHCGVEVHFREWSYRKCEGLGSGVACCLPRCIEEHSYSESIPMGRTMMSEEEVLALVRQLEKDWPGAAYHILRRNCCHFSDVLCKRLGVGGIPDWVTNLASAGAAADRRSKSAAKAAQAAWRMRYLCCGNDAGACEEVNLGLPLHADEAVSPSAVQRVDVIYGDR